MYICSKCSRKLKSKHEYLEHCDSHAINAGKKDYPCTDCQFHFKTRNSFYNHAKVHDIERPKPVEEKVLCRHCKETFTVKTIEKHLQSMPNGIKILCPYCEYGSHPTYNAYTTHKHR